MSIAPKADTSMLDTFKDLTIAQYEAALSVLNACIIRCPETLWDARVAHYKFSLVAFHTLYFTDFYLGQNPQSFSTQPFHLDNPHLFRGHEDPQTGEEPFENDDSPHLYEKSQMLEYLGFCREKARHVVAIETADTLSGQNAFRPNPYSRAELHIYSIRHIGHHSAQLILRLKLDSKEEVPWIGSGWRETVSPPTPLDPTHYD